jgi:hypothetical protein
MKKTQEYLKNGGSVEELQNNPMAASQLYSGQNSLLGNPLASLAMAQKGQIPASFQSFPAGSMFGNPFMNSQLSFEVVYR